MRLMHFGFALPGRGPLATPEALTKLAQRADALRYSSVFVTDHVVIPTSNNSIYPYATSGRFAGDWTNGYLEPLAMMGVLVGLTSRVKIGTSVLVVPYRNPVVTAKILATLDVMSGGRIILGAGVGWMKEEFEALQAPSFTERGKVTDEYLRLMRDLWTKEPVEFTGAHYRLPSVSALPKPRQKPAIPVVIGGVSRAAIRRAARLGDGWQPLGLSPEALGQGITALREEARACGRDVSKIPISIAMSLATSRLGRHALGTEPSEIVKNARAYASLGVETLVISANTGDPGEARSALEMVARDVLPAFRS